MSEVFAILGEGTPADSYGQKAALLSLARARGFAVPAGFALSGEQAQRLVAGEVSMREALGAALEALGPEVSSLAVRASPRASLPGALLTRLSVPRDLEQVAHAVGELLASNEAPSARAQRKARGLSPEAAPLPVLVQRLVRPVQPGDWGAAVFTCDPDRGAPEMRGEYQPGLGAEHVVGGKQTPFPLAPTGAARDAQSLAARDPAAFSELARLACALEESFDEPLELELVRSQGMVWLLQVRPLVLSARALVRLALDAIDADSPRFRAYAERLLHADLGGLIQREFVAAFAPDAPCARGLAASPGVASGVVMTDPERALARASEEPVVLFRPHATPEDVAAVRVSSALVTSSGGLTCHAAVIARGLHVPAVVGCDELLVDAAGGRVQVRGDPLRVLFNEGDPVSVDAHRGLIYAGLRGEVTRIVSPEVQRLAQELRKLRPHPLWAYGEPESSLRAKEEGSLDGIVCPVATADAVRALPRGRGRECWLELPEEHALAWIGLVPPGWGVVVRGALERIPFRALRERARLTPFGVYLDVVSPQTRAQIDLDLVVAGVGVGSVEQLSGLAPRLLLWADSTLDSAHLSRLRGIGALCDTGRSLEWVLRLALRTGVPTSAH